MVGCVADCFGAGGRTTGGGTFFGWGFSLGGTEDNTGGDGDDDGDVDKFGNPSDGGVALVDGKEGDDGATDGVAGVFSASSSGGGGSISGGGSASNTSDGGDAIASSDNGGGIVDDEADADGIGGKGLGSSSPCTDAVVEVVCASSGSSHVVGCDINKAGEDADKEA